MSVSQGNKNKIKNKQTGPSQTLAFVQQRNPQTRQKDNSWAEKISASNVTDKGLISKIYK